MSIADSAAANSSKTDSKRAPLLPRIILGVWLIILYVTLVFFVFMSFSAYQFHVLVNGKIDGSKNAFSINRVLEIQDEWNNIRFQVENKYREIFSTEDKIGVLFVKIGQYEIDLSEIYDECKAQVATVINKDNRRIKLAELKCNPDDLKVLDGAADPLRSATSEAIDAGVKRVQTTKDSIAAVREQIDERQVWLRVLKGEHNALLKQKDLIKTNAQVPEILDFLSAAEFFDGSRRGFLGSVLPDFLRMPTDALVLIIVISMGALGGAMQITRNYLAPEDLTNIDTYQIRYRYIFFHPFLGAITALAVYILFKAGLLVVSTPGDSSQVSLNPFFISFIGIISGMMATVALESIVRVGENWFKSSRNAEKARWANRLTETVEEEANATSRTVDVVTQELLDALGIERTLFDAWRDQKQPVPEGYQRMISVYFRKHERDIFTDIPKTNNAGAT